MLPKEIEIGAHTFRVVAVEPYINDDLGRCDHDTLTIFIKQDMPLSLMWETLLHEVLHAVRHINGTDLTDNEAEERTVQADAHLLFLTLKNNPQLLESIKKLTDEIQIIQDR